MNPLNPQIDHYIASGCGRCPLGGTPQCKVNSWQAELKQLRAIVLACDLTEELKWGMPCYTFRKKNVAMISALKDYCAVSFFKGALLPNDHGVLQKPGENSQAARVMRFTSVGEIRKMKPILKDLLLKAIEVEAAGLKVDFKAKTELTVPEELQQKFDALPHLQSAFSALTPGRQRGYVLYFTAAKQSQTRHNRIEKYIPQILEGRGLHD